MVSRALTAKPILSNNWGSCFLVRCCQPRQNEYFTESRWRGFKQWVRDTQDKQDWLQVSKLKNRSPMEATACNSATISASFNEINALLIETGIAGQDGHIMKSEAHRLLVCDEKGFSQRQDNVRKGVVSNGLRRHASCIGSTVSWEHISATSFLPLSPLPQGKTLPIGVTVPTKSANDLMRQLFPEAKMQGNAGGSNTTSIFNYFVAECFEVIREVVPQHKPVVLILDSGGGSWMHLSLNFVGLCLKYNIRPYFLRAYLTRALCALDQEPHSSMSRLWCDFKQKWSGQISLYVALKAVREICLASLTKEKAAAGWRRCGFQAGAAIDRDKVACFNTPLVCLVVFVLSFLCSD